MEENAEGEEDADDEEAGGEGNQHIEDEEADE